LGEQTAKLGRRVRLEGPLVVGLESPLGIEEPRQRAVRLGRAARPLFRERQARQGLRQEIRVRRPKLATRSLAAASRNRPF
jgi:hypothetical protein